MKKLLDFAGHTVRFAIRRIQKGHTVEFLPMIKEKGLFSSWRPIVKVYEEYIVLDYEKPGGLSMDECLQHIDQCRLQLENIQSEAEIKVEYIEEF